MEKAEREHQFKMKKQLLKQLLITSGIILLILNFVNLVSAGWWDGNWTKKKMINITENSGYDLINYSIKINVTYNDNMQIDFDDLRFVNSTYGNPSATDSSSPGVCPYGIVNGSCAVYFNNFTSALDTSFWCGNYGFFDVNTANEGYLYINTTSAADDRAMWSCQNYSGSLKLKARISHTGSSWGSVGFNYNLSDMHYIYTSDSRDIFYANNGTTYIKISETSAYNDGVYRDYEFAKVGSNFTSWLNNNINGSKDIPNAIEEGSIRIEGRQDPDTHWDYILLSKYALVEPNYSFEIKELTVLVSLISPQDSLQTQNTSIEFTGNFMAYFGNLTNATLYVWNPDGSLFGTNFTTITGGYYSKYRWRKLLCFNLRNCKRNIPD